MFTYIYISQKRYNIMAVEILKKAKIVAMTTTGAAINQRLLSELAAPLVIVEEAAEILESNLLAVLTPHMKHAVLIGDYKQLKPNVRLSLFCSCRAECIPCLIAHYSLPGPDWKSTDSTCQCLRGLSRMGILTHFF